MTYCVVQCNADGTEVVLESGVDRSVALMLHMHHRGEIARKYGLATVWLRDPTNTDRYYLLYKKVFNLNGDRALDNAKSTNSYVARLEVRLEQS